MIANTLRVFTLIACGFLVGRFDMQDDEAATAAAADEARTAMIQLAAEENCAGQVVHSPRGLRCAERDARGEMVARLVEVQR